MEKRRFWLKKEKKKSKNLSEMTECEMKSETKCDPTAFNSTFLHGSPTPICSCLVSFFNSHFISFNYFSISATANVRYSLNVPQSALAGDFDSGNLENISEVLMEATSPVRRVLFISAGASHSVALLSGNIVCSWGRGEDGQLGHGDAEDRFSPTQLSALDGHEIVSVTCGADHTTAYSEARTEVYSWGWGDFGRLGHGNSSDLFTPKPIKALHGLKIRQIACGDSHCLAVTMEGEVQSWGRNQNGQLGLGTTEDSLVPQKIQAFEGIPIKMVAAGAEHTAAVTEDGELFGWGWGRYGNLGLGDRNDRLVPQKVSSVDVCSIQHSLSLVIINDDARAELKGVSLSSKLPQAVKLQILHTTNLIEKTLLKPSKHDPSTPVVPVLEHQNYPKKLPATMTEVDKQSMEETAYEILILNITDNVLRQVINENTTYEIWEKLKALYDKKDLQANSM
ncbi:ultraviolet-B receptor UVR8 isoform X3 [Cucumis melo var. makuwa]|uniref:Ultraviolet-B receptor UVR8 isoform X3 n=1 Tax=Cucumis melo var. makuwa TaxID=1194695 RepID=A0A5D3BUX7_CUCMM|nr:ultraviolet-B receptor UVR8 isoform X3 [Cucumis melo var. makuwa]